LIEAQFRGWLQKDDSLISREGLLNLPMVASSFALSPGGGQSPQ
jgi:hypothetical protein